MMQFTVKWCCILPVPCHNSLWPMNYTKIEHALGMGMFEFQVGDRLPFLAPAV